MKRLLNILSSMNVGGAETMLMKIYRQIDKEKFQMDFILMSEGKSFYEDEIKSLGGKIYHVCHKSKNPIKSFRQLKKIVKNGGYRYVMRSADNAAAVIDLIAAKTAGAKILVFNSTNSRTFSESLKEKIAHKLLSPLVRTIPTLRIGCSITANDFMYGRKSVEKRKSVVFHNALNIEEFAYNDTWRQSIRNELNIPHDAFVIGNVGRLNKQKNHIYLLNVFRELIKRKENSYLVIFGEGDLKESIINEANRFGVSNKLILPGVRKDVNKCLSALDVFAFPSLYEGLPNAVVEAEAAGLPCVLSNTITEEVKIAKNVAFLPISQISIEKWAKTILSFEGSRNANAIYDLEKAGYSIDTTVKQLTNLIFGSDH